MQFPAKRWRKPEGPDGASGAVRGGAALVERLLARRGVAEAAARAAFLEPKLTGLQDPWSLDGMDGAARSIVEAVRAGRRIAIYGDYDADGVMATAILWHALEALRPGIGVRTYVPHRRKEGYGLNADAIRRLADEGVQLIVTVDCGVSAIEEARLVRELGIDLVVTDHHNLRGGGEVPEAIAVVHPRLGTTQRFGELCGAGVAWKLAWALFYEWVGCSRTGRLPAELSKRLMSLLPLAAVGTVADVMPLVDENRTIVAKGLPMLHATGIAGLDALLAKTRMGPAEVEAHDIDPEKVAFRFAPWINACGRMQHADDAVELLTTADEHRAPALVATMAQLNERRRKDSGEIHGEARQAWGALVARAQGAQAPVPSAIVLHDERWNLGIVGIVCSKLVDEFARPAILLTRDVAEGSDLFKGSGRSVPGIDMHAALAQCAHTLEGFGGHAMAAGVKVREDRLEAFAQAFSEVVAAMRGDDDDFRPLLEIDCVCALPELGIPSVRAVEELRPFGRGNPRPALLVEGARVTRSRIFGKTGTHLELTLEQGNRFQQVQWWDGARFAGEFKPGVQVDAVVEVKLGKRHIAEVEATLLDIRLHAEAVSAAPRTKESVP